MEEKVKESLIMEAHFPSAPVRLCLRLKIQDRHAIQNLQHSFTQIQIVTI